MEETIRDNKGRFVKGSPGNKGGRPKVVAEIRKLAQEHGQDAFNRVIELMASDNPKVALAASQEVLNRAYGRPEQSHKVEGDGIGMTIVVIQEGPADD